MTTELTATERLDVIDAKIHAYKMQQYDLELEARIAAKVQHTEGAAQAIQNLKQLEAVLNELALIRKELEPEMAKAA